MSRGILSRYPMSTAAFDDDFYGRQAEIQSVHNRPWAWICGQRRMGKTSLLYRVKKEMETQGSLPLFLSFVFVPEDADGKQLFSTFLEANRDVLDRLDGPPGSLQPRDFARLDAPA